MPGEARAQKNPTVYIVDDDENMCAVVAHLAESVGLDTRSFVSASAFLDYFRREAPGCVLTDVRMPGMSGLELLETLARRGLTIPVILMTSYADVPLAVRALRAGAWDLVEKPFNHQELIDRLQGAVRRDVAAWREQRRVRQAEERFATLSPREREVLDRVARGLANKQIAEELGISPKTVEVHRARLMSKMGAHSMAELIRMAVLAGSGA